MAAFGKTAVWRERMRRYSQSGLTVARFCAKEGVSAPSFYQWRRRLAETPAGKRRRYELPAFQQVTLASARGIVSVALGRGIRIEIPSDNLKVVRAVVKELARAEQGRLPGGASC